MAALVKGGLSWGERHEAEVNFYFFLSSPHPFPAATGHQTFSILHPAAIPLAAMTENEIEGLSARFANTHIKASAESAPDSTPNKTPGNGTISHSRVDSHQEGANCVSPDELRLARSRDTLRKTQAKLEHAEREINMLKGAVEMYKTEWKKVLSKAFTINGGEVSLQAELEECKREVVQMKAQNIQLKQQDSLHEMKLDGRLSAIPCNISFTKDYGYDDDLSTAVVLSKTYIFTKRLWRENGRDWKGNDDAAVGCLKLDGRSYTAKAGQTREDFGDFIYSEQWREKAMFLADIVDSDIERNYAIHAEPQLIAFYITRTLQKSGYGTSKFGEEETFPDRGSDMALEPIVIHVSQKICDKCEEFASKINNVAKRYGYYFELKNCGTGSDAGTEYDEELED